LAPFFAVSLLGACSPRMSNGDSSAYVPQTGSSGGAVVPNARPGMQSAPAGASTAGSNLGRM